MKKHKDRIEKTAEDRPCSECGASFRECPMDMVLALSRVPAGMEVLVVACPERKPKPKP